jgi:hypothetical protein
MKKFITFVLLSIIVLTALSACGASQQAFFGVDVDMGTLPEDICYINGKPQVLGASTESDGDIKLFYLRNDGYYVLQQYSFPGIRKAGNIFWEGGVCAP